MQPTAILTTLGKTPRNVTSSVALFRGDGADYERHGGVLDDYVVVGFVSLPPKTNPYTE